MPVEPHFGELAVELALPRRTVPARELVEHHPAGVVTVTRVLAARIAEADDEEVERRGAFASTPREAHLALGGAGLALLARGRLGGRLALPFGRTPRLLAPRNLPLGQFFALLDLRLGLLDARRHGHRREHRLLRVIEVGDAV